MKRKTSAIILCFCLTAALAGCAAHGENGGPAGTEDAACDFDSLASDLCASDAFSDILSPVSDEIARGLYGYEAEDVLDCTVMCSTGATSEEIGLFRCADEEAAIRVAAAAESRALAQKSAYESYAPDEIPKLDDAVIESKGEYVFFVVSKNRDAVKKLLDEQ
ncbi:MAG: DUF4358 domain-containing protein [Clostridia bacterium]|nr:DUF4358 domain-containing protein [Clostridia bacterium]